ncbi:hypothetical protein ACHAWF_004546 [Thalassiosira exigua]
MTMPSAKYAPVAVPVTSSGGGASSSSSAFNRELEERFVAAVPVDAPSPEASPYLEVVSPATLPEVRRSTFLFVVRPRLVGFPPFPLPPSRCSRFRPPPPPPRPLSASSLLLARRAGVHLRSRGERTRLHRPRPRGGRRRGAEVLGALPRGGRRILRSGDPEGQRPRGPLEGRPVRLLRPRVHSSRPVERVVLPPGPRGAGHEPPQAHLARRGGGTRGDRGRHLPHPPRDHDRLPRLVSSPGLRLARLRRRVRRAFGRVVRPPVRVLRPRLLFRAVHDVPGVSDASADAGTVRHTGGPVQGVRGLLLRVLVHVLHGGADGATHGRLRDVRGGLLQRDGDAGARAVDRVIRDLLGLDGKRGQSARDRGDREDARRMDGKRRAPPASFERLSGDRFAPQKPRLSSLVAKLKLESVMKK